jgi:hypothetical protein
MEGADMPDRDDRIRERAYQMWEEQGCPDGLAGDHWYAAEQELAEYEVGGGVVVKTGEELSEEPAKKKR